MLGLYLHRVSPVHGLPAGAKLAGLFATAAVVMLAPGIVVASAGLFALGLAALARLPFGALSRQLRPFLPIALAIFIVQALLAGWQDALLVVGRLGVLILFATVVTLSTRVSDMMDTLERALRPLRPLGVNAGKVSLMLTLSIRLIPILLELLGQIRMARLARGAGRNPSTLFVPLMVKTLRMADTLAEALEARGYDPK